MLEQVNLIKTHKSDFSLDDNNIDDNDDIGQHLPKGRIPSPHGPHRRPIKKRPLAKDEEF